MTVTYKDTAWNDELDLKIVDVTIEIPFTLDMIDYTRISQNEYGIISFPIKMDHRPTGIDSLAYTIANGCEYIFCDYEKTSLTIVVDHGSYNFNPLLVIEVAPPKWTMADVDGGYITRKMVRASKDFYSGVDLGFNENRYKISFTSNELQDFMWMLLKASKVLSDKEKNALRKRIKQLKKQAA